ncbi:hypothetical protein QTI66_14950 [Variovorax sp. J22R133]|uniref:hypothetical protein n=1 Tax=Variovorax brevis TaxID=3053503 RepID=UPI0025754B73|nr:hypothetical protein [Variovorax sp. J22R133]MDM0113455.1 hypothetical protein [Variovorax sp. J22R133]
MKGARRIADSAASEAAAQFEKGLVRSPTGELVALVKEEGRAIALQREWSNALKAMENSIDFSGGHDLRLK